MGKVLLAGATGYLGSFILEELLKQGLETRIIVRNEKKLPLSIKGNDQVKLLKAEVTQPASIENCCRDIDTVISTVGITRQKDGLTYMDVDFQANMNLLKEAMRSGVKKFIYVSILHGDELRRLRICDAKERFVDSLKESGLDYCIIRPGGYFSDMGEFYQMARKGKVFLFGNGEHRINPIHGADLAAICVNAIHGQEKEIPAGGPQTFTYNQIAQTALSVAEKGTGIIHIPGWISKWILGLLRTFTSSKTYGPIEFFLTVLSMDLVGPPYGTHTLKEYFEELKK
ncbi:MAG: SDR family oxidoreductase [Chitinophagaceae bacterium]|nr:MAG: SDR family oxidoreductase [Chitinophagaceae bacterium]